MTARNVIVRPGHRFGWWVEGRKANGKLFMKTWCGRVKRWRARWPGGWAGKMTGRPATERPSEGWVFLGNLFRRPGRPSRCGPCSADPLARCSASSPASGSFAVGPLPRLAWTQPGAGNG